MKNEVVKLMKEIPTDMREPVLLSFLLRVLKHQPDKIIWLKEQITCMHKINLENEIKNINHN